MLKLDLRPKSILKRLVFAYVLICLFMWVFQRHLIYMPMTNIQAPDAYGLHGFTDMSLKSGDGTHIHAWYHAARTGYPTVVYFHGNGGNLATRANYFQLLNEAGFGVLALDYRGYGASEGSPSEEGFYQDARALMDYAAQLLSLPPKRMIIYGESIGTGVAVQIATEYPSAALVLQSPFTSMEALATDNYPWLPVNFLLQDRFDSLSKIARTHAPLLLFHGEQDTIVPIKFGKILFDSAPTPKESIYFPENGHVNFDLKSLTEALITFSRKYQLIQTQSKAEGIQ